MTRAETLSALNRELNTEGFGVVRLEVRAVKGRYAVSVVSHGRRQRVPRVVDDALGLTFAEARTYARSYLDAALSIAEGRILNEFYIGRNEN
jgi:hypothetical protein